VGRQWESSLIRDARDGAPKYHGWWQGDQDQVGAFLHGFDSLWLPASLLDEDRQTHLAGALFAASRYKQVQLHINKGLAGAPPEALAATRQTATNPAVLDAFALAIIADGERPAYAGLARPAMDLAAARKDARDIDRAAAELRKIVPHAGSYVSESNYFNRSWQNAYWGENYSRLRADQDPIRSRWTLLRSPRCGQRGLERRRLYAPYLKLDRGRLRLAA
jgi:hypothetical protein